jgi:hypothetical protein
MLFVLVFIFQKEKRMSQKFLEICGTIIAQPASQPVPFSL